MKHEKILLRLAEFSSLLGVYTRFNQTSYPTLIPNGKRFHAPFIFGKKPEINLEAKRVDVFVDYDGEDFIWRILFCLAEMSLRKRPENEFAFKGFDLIHSQIVMNKVVTTDDVVSYCNQLDYIGIYAHLMDKTLNLGLKDFETFLTEYRKERIFGIQMRSSRVRVPDYLKKPIRDLERRNKELNSKRKRK